MTPASGGKAAWFVGVSTAAMILAPLLTVGLPFRVALFTQAAMFSIATLALVSLAVVRGRWGDRTRPPRPLLVGVVLYAAAALQGVAVAVLRGNDTVLIAGQFLAMGLLPVVAAAAWGISPAIRWRSFAAGLVAGVTAMTLIQLAVVGPASLVNPEGPRLILGNALSASGPAPLALLLALALSRSGRPFAKRLTWAAIAVIALVIFGSRIRSQWLVMPVGLAAYLAFALGRARLFSRRVALGFGVAVLLAASLAAITITWWTYPRPNLLATVLDSGSRGSSAAAATLPADPVGAIRVRGTITCRTSGSVSVRAQTWSESRAGFSDAKSRVVVTGSVPAGFHLLLRPGAQQRQISVALEDHEHLDCKSSTLDVEEIAPTLPARLVGGIVGLFYRPPDPSAGAVPGAFAGDASISFRIHEAHAVLSAMRSGSWSSWLFGHGLGATFDLNTLGYDNRGNIVRYDRTNYIHNFYLFLVFKLGLLGALEVVAGLALFVVVAARGASTWPSWHPERCFFAAAAASWITYMAWSVAAPEILDFRFAPFWGILVAVTATELRAGPGSTRVTRDPAGRPDAVAGPAPLSDA
jgi:O-antigen ligase